MSKKFKKALNKKEYRVMLNDICSDNCSESNDCVLKEFLVSAHNDPRLLMQMKCVEKFKEIIAQEKEEKKKDIEWSDAMGEWIKRGYAKKFAEVYEEGGKYISIYKMIMENE